MSCLDFAQFDARLRELTCGRAELTRPEWAELYGIVVRVLRAERLLIYTSLPGTPEEYINDYFQDRILRVGAAGSCIDHTCALVKFYFQYLQRQVDAAYLGDQSGSSPPQADGQPDRIELETARQALESWQQGEQAPETLGALVDLAAQVCEQQGLGQPLTGALGDVASAFERHLGLQLSALRGAAQDFLFAVGPWSKLSDDAWWIRLYLRRHQCPDQDRGDSTGPEPLSRLEQLCNVPAYHRKAVKLGVAVPKGQAAAFAAFAKSYRGRWLISVGIPVDPEHQAEMAIALKILCVVALSGDGPATDACGRLLP